MKSVTTQIIINAPAKKVWDILMDFNSYEEWNPFVKSIEGAPQAGNQITVQLSLEGQKPQTFKPKVLRLEEQREFRWLGHLFFPGLFDGEHYFILETTADNQTKFIQGENFKGILSGLIMNMIGEKTVKGFKAMNKALKLKAEA